MMKGFLVASMLTVFATAAFVQAQVEKNVVYGMYSGTALLMDVYRPAQSNGLGLILIGGSNWYMPQRYDAPSLKDTFAGYGRRFAEAG